MLIPYPLGDALHVAYIGRWYLWEMSAYAGIINLALAGIALATMQHRCRWRMVVLLIVIVILMLGSYTPLHWWLYQYLPGFSLFRGASKFAALMTLLLSILAGEGLDRIRERFLPRAALSVGILAAACFITGAVFWRFDSPGGPAGRLIAAAFHSTQYYDPILFTQPNLAAVISRWIAWQFYIAGALLVATATLLLLRRWSSKAIYLLLGLAIAEVYFCGNVFSRRISSCKRFTPHSFG